MAKRVTDADRAAAERLKSIWLSIERSKRPTQQALADGWPGPGSANQSAIAHYFNGRNALNHMAVLYFAKALGVEPEAIRSDLPEQRLSPRPPDLGDWRAVEASTQGIAAGGGRVPDDYAETHQLLFRARSLQRKGLKTPDLQVHYVVGDSMEPRLKDGDAILVDTSDTKIKDGSIYWIRHDGEHFVKVLHKAGDAIIIESLNKANPQWRKPVVVKPGDDFEVIGRMRWVGSWED